MIPPLKMMARKTRAAASVHDSLPALLADIRARRSEFNAAQRLPDDIFAGFKRLGVYRAMVAKRFGAKNARRLSFVA